MKRHFVLTWGLLAAMVCFADVYAVAADSNADPAYTTEQNILYRETSVAEKDAYVNERCRLDIYYSKEKTGFATIVWFHGGGLTGGEKHIPEPFKSRQIAVIAVNYRLSPKVSCPTYIDDAAAAVAWAFKNISRYGGDPNLIFVSGHSAGGYLTSMVGLDRHYLAKYGVDANKIAGLLPVSGHTITHFTVRQERGIPGTQAIIDELAPLYHVRADAPPLVLTTGGRDLEMLGRYEENAYLKRMMEIAGHKETTLYEIQGFDHGGMVEPAYWIVLKQIDRIIASKK